MEWEAYLSFSKVQRPLILEKYPDTNFILIASRLQKKWEKMSFEEKQKWMPQNNVKSYYKR